MSDPLLLSPETEAGRRLRKWVHRASMEPLPDDVTLETIIAIEQEARTLARAEVQPVFEAARRVLDRSHSCSSPGYCEARDKPFRDLAAALSRLGERERP